MSRTELTEPFTIKGPCHRPAGKMVVTPHSERGGFKTRACHLAESLGARWSGQAGGYVMSPAATVKLRALYAAGFWGAIRLFGDEPARFDHYERDLRGLTAAQALVIAKGGAA